MSGEAPYGRTEDDAPFWEAARNGSLVLQRCDRCEFVRWPAAGVCPECLSRSSTWTEVEGAGTLWSNVVYHRAYAPALKENVPYSVGLVELDCGARILSHLFGVEAGLDTVGARVAVHFQEVGEHGVVPVFGPALESEEKPSGER